MKKIAPVLFALALMLMLIASMARADSNPLASQTGINIGLSLSSYQYREADMMSLTGAKFGLELRGTKTLQQQFFVAAICAMPLARLITVALGTQAGIRTGISKPGAWSAKTGRSELRWFRHTSD